MCLVGLMMDTRSISEHDPDFWKVYRNEKRMLLEVLVHADETLVARAREQVGEDSNE